MLYNMGTGQFFNKFTDFFLALSPCEAQDKLLSLMVIVSFFCHGPPSKPSLYVYYTCYLLLSQDFFETLNPTVGL